MDDKNTEDRPPVLAFYVVVDVSLSMAASKALDAASAILPKVAGAVRTRPALGDVVRFGAMEFSDDARIVLPLSDLRDLRHGLPAFAPRGGTSYAAAFGLLRQEIDKDLARLRMDDHRVHRPAVFFITDGEPTDDAALLLSSFGELTDPAFPGRPDIIPFGVGAATKELLDPWVHPKPADGGKPMRSYVARAGVGPAAAIDQIAEVILASVFAAGDGGFAAPADGALSDWI
jgi:hypothetical protein